MRPRALGLVACLAAFLLMAGSCQSGDKATPMATRADLEELVRSALLMPNDLEGAWCCESDERKFHLNDVCGAAHWDNSFLHDTAADVNQQNDGVPPAVLEYILVLQPGGGPDCLEIRRENAQDRPQLEFPNMGDASFAFQEVDEPGYTQSATILDGDVIISVAFEPWREDFDATALERYARLALEKWERTLAEWN